MVRFLMLSDATSSKERLTRGRLTRGRGRERTVKNRKRGRSRTGTAAGNTLRDGARAGGDPSIL